MSTVTQQRVLPLRQADWTGNVTLDQTDPALGIQSITLGLTATLNSTAWVYSLERAPSSFSSSDTASVTLGRPDGSALLTANPNTFISTQLAASTGTPTPTTMLPATASDSVGTTYIAGAAPSPDAALLIGTGAVTLPVAATARVSATAPGNFGALFSTQVDAVVTATVASGGSLTSTTGTVGSVVTPAPIPFLPLLSDITTPKQHIQIAPSTTGWIQALGIAGFNPSLGTLKSVNVTVTANANANLQAENLDPVAAALNVTQTATIDLDANGAVLDSQSAAVTTNRTLGAYDGTVDNAGVSGESLFGQTANGTASAFLTDAASLAAFTGAAPTVTVAGIGQTTINGPGALSIGAGLQAGASIDVSYTYSPGAGTLFDATYYLAHNPDVAAAGVDPYQHYLTYGWHEGRDPSALFDTNYYLTQNPDVRAAGVDPLLHFATYGWAEGRDPSLLFSDSKYLAANPAVTGDPLLSYTAANGDVPAASLLTGGTLPADPLVNAAFYDAQLGATLLPTGTAAAQQAAWSYDSTGWQKGLNPDPLFDTKYYLAHNPDVAAAHVDPLLHYETYGWKEGRDPSAAFNTSKYLAAYTDVRAAGMDPLLHYVQYGQAEHRTAFAV